MTHPTDDELEAMAQYWTDQIPKAVSQDAMFAAAKFDKTAAMLRACKGRVRVKPLVWEQARDGAGWHPQLTIAYCPLFEKRFYAEHPGKQAKIEAAREARILAALEPAPDQGEWKPIETAPKDHLLFYGNTRHDSRIVFSGWKAVNGTHYCDKGDIVHPTHWMPLPAPPPLKKGPPHD